MKQENKISEQKIRESIRKLLDTSTGGGSVVVSRIDCDDTLREQKEFSKENYQKEVLSNLANSIKDYAMFSEVSSKFSQHVGLKPSRRELFEHLRKKLESEFENNLLEKSDYIDLEWGSRNAPLSFFLNEEFISSFISSKLPKRTK